MTMNIFEYATRNGLRFTSFRGALTTEDLWNVPLRSRDGFDLDAVARAASKAVKELSEESFVAKAKTPEHARRETALEVVKHVIEVKLAEEATAKNRAAKKAEKEALLKILEEKQKGAMSALSEEDIKKRIVALDNDE